MSLLDEIRKLITGERTQGEMSEAYLGNPEYMGTSRATIDKLISPRSVRNLPAHMNVALNQSPKSANYIAPELANDNGVLSLLNGRGLNPQSSPTDNSYFDAIPYSISGQRPNYDGMSGDLSSYVDATRKNYENYQTDQQFMKEALRDAKVTDEYLNTLNETGSGNNWGSTESGQGQPFNPLKGNPDVINPANDFTLYADGLNARVDSGYTKDVEKDSMEQTILDRAKEKAEEKKLTEGSSNFVSYGQNMPVSDTKPTLSQADVDKMTVNYTNTGEKYTKDNTDVSFLDKVGDFVGNKERMLKLALAFNSMRLEPDQGLATALNDRLKTLSKQGKANSTAEYLRNKGRPDLADLILKNPELSTQALQEVRQSNKFKIMKGADLEKEYGITGLPSKQNFKYNTLTGEISGIGQGNTVIQNVKPDKGYQFEYDDYGNVVRQVPIPKALTKEEKEVKEEKETAKNVASSVITTASDNISDKIFGDSSFLPTTGTIGKFIGGFIGESDANVVKRNLDVLGSQGSISSLQAMRRQSKTGGALGNVTERELAMLKASLGVLDQAMSRDDFIKGYMDYTKKLMMVVHGDIHDGQTTGISKGQEEYAKWEQKIRQKYGLDENMQKIGNVQTGDPKSQIVDFKNI